VFSWLGAYDQFVGGTLLIHVLLVLSLFVVFQCGVLSLATVGFMADGAYTAALLSTKGHLAPGLCIAAGALLTGVLALVVGRVILRLRGIYLALGTFAFGQVCVLLIANWSYTGGTAGIIGIPTSVGMTTAFVAVVVVCVLLQLLHRSRYGRALRAMRLDDRVAAGVGVNTTNYRVLAFAASGVIAGLAGGLDAFRTVIISPGQYNFTLLVQLLALAMIGGAYHWFGGVVSALVIGLIQQELGLQGPLVQGLLYGGLLLVVMLLLPEGIVDRRMLRWFGRRVRRRSNSGAATPPASATRLQEVSGS
jgi:branched-chain amino acid transport system permease protein